MTAVDMSMSYRGLEAMSPAGLRTHKDKEIAMGDFLFFSTFSGGQNDDPTPGLAVPVPTSDMNTIGTGETPAPTRLVLVAKHDLISRINVPHLFPSSIEHTHSTLASPLRPSDTPRRRFGDRPGRLVRMTVKWREEDPRGA